MLTLLISSALIIKFNIQSVEAIETIYIRADGSIEPSTAPISTADNVMYTLTDNIMSDADGIVIERDNITLDGAGYTLQGIEGYVYTGIALSGRVNVTVKNMEIKDFDSGIILESSSNNSICENNVKVSYSGIYLMDSSNNSVTRNNITSKEIGMQLGWSFDCSIVGNTFTKCGLFVMSSQGNLVAGNLVNGKPLVYLEGMRSDYTVDYAGQVILINCRYIRLENLEIRDALIGVELWQTEDFSITRNTITANLLGIMLWISDGIITENNITDNQRGILTFGSYSVSIFHNNFKGNGHVVAPGSEISLWGAYPSGGNYWGNYWGTDSFFGPYQNLTGSDGIGDTPYEIGENNVDHYPLMSPYEYWSNPFPGDVNKDMKVNLKDITQILDGFGSSNSSDGFYWHTSPCTLCPHCPNLDIDRDNKIALTDITTALDNFRKTYP
jgi:parallel beta-helix repeat protein